uniref:Uncharacterized protein n=1 Tax=Oryza meridionalis TaxID=40149 RepID=A0A0E0C2E8_9ORYZ
MSLQGAATFISNPPLPGTSSKRRVDDPPSSSRSFKHVASKQPRTPIGNGCRQRLCLGHSRVGSRDRRPGWVGAARAGTSGPEAAGQTVGDLGELGGDMAAATAKDTTDQGTDGGIGGGGVVSYKRDTACAYASSPFSVASFSPVSFSSASLLHGLLLHRVLSRLHTTDPGRSRLARMRKSWKKFHVGSARCCRPRFNDAADKADCTTMYEAGLVLLEKMQKIVNRSTAKSEALRSVFDNITEIEQI